MRGLISLGMVAGLGLGQAACHLPIDVFFVQDTTGSFIPDLPVIKAQIPEIINRINVNNPGSRFGVAEFRDKPYLNLGELNDFCYRLNHPLSTDITSVQNAFGTLFASGGADLPEAQFQAVIDAVNDPLVGWRTVSQTPTEGEVGARLIIMSTDATPHDPLDYELYPATAPAYMPPFPDNVSGISSDTLCRRYDYPTEAQLKAQLVAHNTYFAILTPRNNVDGGKAAARWREINDVYLGNPSGFFQYIDAGSADLVTSLLTVLDSVTQYVCALTTTPAPETQTTTVATTVATTTVIEATTTATVATTTVTEATTVATEATTVATEATTVATEATTVATEATTVATEPTTVATETTTVATTEATTTVTEATTVATTTVATTTPALTTEEEDVTVTPAAPTQTLPATDGPVCPPTNECPEPCACVGKYGLVVRVNDTPQKLLIDYQK